jgi:hypothetical protein
MLRDSVSVIRRMDHHGLITVSEIRFLRTDHHGLVRVNMSDDLLMPNNPNTVKEKRCQQRGYTE